ncbi:hypothetical protein [Massilia sp. METH4]|uniref:hypothetical protein n=1 Tax=Massilia sp. METH4 TaxID=3123041 RepID=UPI0030D47DD5
MDAVAGFMFNVLMEVIMYNIGRAAIAVFSFGRVRTEGFSESVSAGTRDGRIVVPVMAAQLIGVTLFSLFWIVFFALRK